MKTLTIHHANDTLQTAFVHGFRRTTTIERAKAYADLRANSGYGPQVVSDNKGNVLYTAVRA